MNVRIELRRDAGRIGPTSGPWIRNKQIARVQGAASGAGLAQVVTKKGETLGWGLFSPESALTVRMLTLGPNEPAPNWMEQRLDAAFAARDAYGFASRGTSGYRAVNSEGDGIPGLVIDRYGEDYVAQVTTAPMAARQPQLMQWLRDRGFLRCHVLRPEAAAHREGFEPGVHRDHAEPSLRFTEHRLAFEAPAPPSQKTGAYFDQRENRRIVAELAAAHGGPLLDIGCHVGGFALHARAAGVRAVAIDQSQLALEHARRNEALNAWTNSSAITWVAADMFGPLDHPALKGPFGTIVLDPPKIATRRSNIDRAVSALAGLVRRVTHRLAPRGHLVVCSCSHHLNRDHLDRAVAHASAGRRWVRVHSLGAGMDHPIMPGHREGEYLRVSVYQQR